MNNDYIFARLYCIVQRISSTEWKVSILQYSQMNNGDENFDLPEQQETRVKKKKDTEGIAFLNCSCCANAYRGLPCFHILAVWHESDLDNISLRILSRWRNDHEETQHLLKNTITVFNALALSETEFTNESEEDEINSELIIGSQKSAVNLNKIEPKNFNIEQKYHKIRQTELVEPSPLKKNNNKNRLKLENPQIGISPGRRPGKTRIKDFLEKSEIKNIKKIKRKVSFQLKTEDTPKSLWRSQSKQNYTQEPKKRKRKEFPLLENEDTKQSNVSMRNPSRKSKNTLDNGVEVDPSNNENYSIRLRDYNKKK